MATSNRENAHARFDEYAYLFETSGLVRIPDFLTEREIGTIKRLVARWNEDFCDRHGYTSTKFPFLEIDPIFMDLMADEFIIRFCEKYVGEWFRLDHAFGLQQPTRRRTADGGWEYREAINLHGGPLCSQGSCFNVTMHGRMWLGQLNVGLVLHGQDGDGGFCYLPGGHNLATSGLEGREVLRDILKSHSHPALIVPRLEEGDLVFFTEAIVHGMAPWKQPEAVRQSLYYKYSPGFLAWRDAAEIAKYLPLARTEVQRRLLRPPYVAQYADDPTVGENDFREPTRPRPREHRVVERLRKLNHEVNEVGEEVLHSAGTWIRRAMRAG